jgi:methylmalonyl-CoA mutase C-terminal domain/subunit
MKLLRDEGCFDIKVIAGGIIPDKDIPGLKSSGILEIFPPGTTMKEIVKWIENHV